MCAAIELQVDPLMRYIVCRQCVRSPPTVLNVTIHNGEVDTVVNTW